MKQLVLVVCTMLLVACGTPNSIENYHRSDTPALPARTSIQFPGQVIDAIAFKPLLSLVPGGEVKLANGTVVSREDWNAVLVTKFVIDPEYSTYCTATILGPNVVLTAAHCVDDGNSQSMPASIATDIIPIALDCTMHPTWIEAGAGFHLKSDADYAICLASRNIENIDYENIDIQQPLVIDDSVTLTGYGCTDIAVDLNDKITYVDSEGILRIGNDEIHLTDHGSSSPDSTGTMALTYSPQNTEPTLCPGDSGGPVFKDVSETKRSVVAVNSAVSWNGQGNQANFFSILAPLAQPIFTSFLEQWMQANGNAKICGYNLNRGTQGCRI